MKKLIEFVLPYIIGVVVHKREILTQKELQAQKSFLAGLDIKRSKTKKPVIVAFIGLVGSGKSSIAYELARHIGATVIEGDDIRIELRKLNERYERTRAIAENIALEVVRQGGNAVLDSDFIDRNKRASIRRKAKKAGIRLIFIRTHCDTDIAIGRIIEAPQNGHPHSFFNGASSTWKDGELKGAIVKIREMWRRTPHHYRWVDQNGGKWMLKKLPFDVFAEIDTVDESEWKQKVEACAKKLL